MNLDTLAARLKEGRLQPGAVITMRTLQEAGIIGKQVTSGVKLLGKVCTCPSANSMLVMNFRLGGLSLCRVACHKERGLSFLLSCNSHTRVCSQPWPIRLYVLSLPLE